MRRFSARWGHFSTLIAASLGLAAQLPAAPIKIGVLLKDRTPGFWIFAEEGIKQEAKALGVDVIIKAPPTIIDLYLQSRLLNVLAAEKVDALVVASINTEVIEGTITAIAKTGVKIVTIDTPLKEGIANVFVGADQAAIGEEAAKIFVGLTHDGEEVALLRNNALDRTVVTRETSLREAMQRHPKVILHSDIFASSEKNSEDEQAKVLLDKYPKVTVVFASATRGTLAMVKAVREKRLVGRVKVAGFGTYLPPEAAKAIEDGILYLWVAQEPKDLGIKALHSAVALVRGETVPAVVRPDYVIVTPENFHSPEVQALLNP